jgi:hypothetical protein
MIHECTPGFLLTKLELVWQTGTSGRASQVLAIISLCAPFHYLLGSHLPSSQLNKLLEYCTNCLMVALLEINEQL